MLKLFGSQHSFALNRNKLFDSIGPWLRGSSLRYCSQGDDKSSSNVLSGRQKHERKTKDDRKMNGRNELFKVDLPSEEGVKILPAQLQSDVSQTDKSDVEHPDKTDKTQSKFERGHFHKSVEGIQPKKVMGIPRDSTEPQYIFAKGYFKTKIAQSVNEVADILEAMDHNRQKSKEKKVKNNLKVSTATEGSREGSRNTKKLMEQDERVDENVASKEADSIRSLESSGDEGKVNKWKRSRSHSEPFLGKRNMFDEETEKKMSEQIIRSLKDTSTDENINETFDALNNSNSFGTEKRYRKGTRFVKESDNYNSGEFAWDKPIDSRTRTFKGKMNDSIGKVANYLARDFAPVNENSKNIFVNKVVKELSTAAETIHKAPYKMSEDSQMESFSSDDSITNLRDFLRKKAIRQKSLSDGHQEIEKVPFKSLVFKQARNVAATPGTQSNALEDSFDGNIFVEDRLGIFDNEDVSSVQSTNLLPMIPSTTSVFDSIEMQYLRLLNHTLPINQFEEWIQWTRDGMLWKFPIDNDQDSPELDVSFHEHVFLVNQLPKMKFPNSEPIIQFMRLVCLGLSHNPHLTVAEKREHLEWFKQYFSDKVELIEQYMTDAKTKREREESLRAEYQ